MMQISSMKVVLLALVLVTYVGPSASPPQEDEYFDVLDLDEVQEPEYPRDPNALKDKDVGKSEDYYYHEDSQVKHKMSSDRKHKYAYKSIPNEEVLDYVPIIEKAKGNPTSELDFKRMIQFPWTKGRKGKPHGASKMKNQYCRVSPPTGRPCCHRTTADSSPSCPYTAPPPMSPPPPPPPTPKPPPCRDQSNKCRQKPKFRTLKAKTGKMLLKNILDTKQHVLFVLEILNHLENEVLFRLPDTCHRQYHKMKAEAPAKGRTAAKKKSAKPQKQAKLQSYGDYHRKGHSSMPMARAKKLRQKEHPVSIDPQDNWCPAVPYQANRAKFMENELQPAGMNKHSYKKYHSHDQKQQSKMKNIPPGMIAIII